MQIKAVLSLLLISYSSFTLALQPAVTKTISTDDLQKYSSYTPTVKNLIEDALKLAGKNLTYLFGSADPKNKGMDCSGTIYHLLTQEKVSDVPRASDGMYRWVVQSGKFYKVSATNFSSDEFSHLKPGDLLFWTGTYDVKRNPPISHVMLYLGKDKDDKPIMFGASDGRTYKGKRMWGVSVFDFNLPRPESKSKFIGYSCIPELSC